MTVTFTETQVIRMDLRYPVGNNLYMSATIEPDPLGDVNRIVSLVRRNSDGTQTKIRSALAPVNTGTIVKFGKGPLERPGDDPTPWPLPLFIPCWFIEVDGRRVLQVLDHEIWPTPPTPKVPWHRRARHTLSCPPAHCC